MDDFDWAIVGGGAVGLATAYSLGRRGRRLVLVERHPQLGQEQSTNNSGVLHSGIFARPGTLRARLNVEGHKWWRAHASEWGVPVEETGTLVVAFDPSQVGRLDEYLAWGRANGAEGVARWGAAESKRAEPAIAEPVAALWSPTGARVDVARAVAALERESRRAGAEIVRSFELAEANRGPGGWTLKSRDGRDLRARRVVNSAGVEAGRAAALFGADGFRVYPCLGEYARVRPPRSGLVRSMVYAIAPPGYPGIGVHLTRTLGGELWIGPTAEYLDSPTLPAERRTSLAEFSREVSLLLPGTGPEELEFAHRGIRAKIVPPGSPNAFDDYVIREAPEGSGVVQLIGIESPGLTACVAVGEYVATTFDAAL